MSKNDQLPIIGTESVMIAGQGGSTVTETGTQVFVSSSAPPFSAIFDQGGTSVSWVRTMSKNDQLTQHGHPLSLSQAASLDNAQAQAGRSNPKSTLVQFFQAQPLDGLMKPDYETGKDCVAIDTEGDWVILTGKKTRIRVHHSKVSRVIDRF